MKLVIVPVDFSATSVNAARYAMQLLTGHSGVRMVLYHVYEKAGQADDANQQLEKLKTELREVGAVKVETLAEQGTDFISELEIFARHQLADLIIMSIKERSVIGQTFLGSNSLKLVEKRVCPVLIIPENATYREVKNVLLASDFKNVNASTPSMPIKKVLKTFSPSLHIVNVSTEHYVAITEEYQAEKNILKKMFSEFNPEFYFLGLEDVDEAINQFAEDKQVDFIIIIHKGQTLFSRFFIKSHTKKLAYSSSIPVLAVHA